MQGRPTLDDLIANLSVGFPRAIFEGMLLAISSWV